MMGKCVARRSGTRPGHLVALPTSLPALVASVLLLCGTVTSGTRLKHSRHLDMSSQFSGKGVVSLDENHNHKPVFSNCSNYAPVMKEDEPLFTEVIQVHAEDKDPPEEGGTITYSFVTVPGKSLKFEIDNKTSLIRTIHYFDRDEPPREKEAYLTVRATDNGTPELYDICTFKVTIEDINDNKPVFDKVAYKKSVPQDLPVGRKVMRVFATDIDDGNNSVVRYSLSSTKPDDAVYFRIDEESGIIFLNKSIDRNPDYEFRMMATVKDMGNKSMDIDLDIRVVESHKKAPTFLPRSPEPLRLQENFSDFDASIVRLKAVSNIDNSSSSNNSYLIFELVTGRTEQTNKENTFRLVRNKNDKDVADIKLSKHLDYESNTQYSLIVRVKNNYHLAAEMVVDIEVLDVNDNIPVFRDFKKGNVLENEPRGVPVMQVRAIDADGTSANNQVTYELDNFNDLFAIDPQTGNITTLVTFDREVKDIFFVTIIATDNSPSALFKTGEHNKGEQTVIIEIGDKNDNPPRFTKKVYTHNSIYENANINVYITEVKAIDSDTASHVTYSIISGNTDDSFNIEAITGKIRVNKPLDYEKITKYNLTVRAFDGVFNDTAQVEIFIENVNDNPPVFEDFNKNLTIEEEKMVDGCITTVVAYDPDIVDRNADQHIAYFIVLEDQQPLIGIDKIGCMKLKKPLDRDPPNGHLMWFTVYVMAIDEDHSSTALEHIVTINITLIDINDNAPFLDMPYPVIWGENKPPGMITELKARDYDSEENGPPFDFKIDNTAADKIKSKFHIYGTNLYARVMFDRERRKSYDIPIAITDSGVPPMTGTSTLTVIIGDENDNPMR